MRRRYLSRLLVAAAIIALGWLLFASGDSSETSRLRRFQDDTEAADSAKSTGLKSPRVGKNADEGDDLEVAREGQGRHLGSAVDQIRWRNAPDSDADTARGPSGEMDFHGGAEAILLDPLTVLEESGIVQLSGEDPLAPRALVAWRIRKGKQSILGRGSSDKDGEIHFPRVLLPQNGLKVVVTDALSAPGGSSSSTSQSLPGRLPVAPQARLIDFSGGEYWFRITPMEGVGTVLLADSSGAIFAAYGVGSTPYRAERIFDVGVNSPGSFILIGHEFSDGRASDWRVVGLDSPDLAATGFE